MYHQQIHLCLAEGLLHLGLAHFSFIIAIFWGVITLEEERNIGRKF